MSCKNLAHQESRAAMTEAPSLVKLPFRVHFMLVHGPGSSPTVRMLLVEITRGQIIYEGLGAWPQFSRWIAQLLEIGIPAPELAAARKLLRRKRLATIKEVQVSLPDIELLGLSRANTA
jgi:hypothetical protein